jgi:hypothetical protein
LLERYPELFESETPEAGAQVQYNFHKKWSGYSAIYQLSKGNILTFDEVLALPLEKCLLFLAFESDKQRMETMIHKEAMKKYQK